MSTVQQIHNAVRAQADSDKASFLQRFFKTGPGEYAHGDVFLGVTVPIVRRIVRQFPDVSMTDIEALLRSRLHEERLLALLFLVREYTKADEKMRKRIYRFYLSNTQYINNWDLVDSSAPYIIGNFLADKDRKVLYRLARSNNLWERRIAMVSTFHFIRNNQYRDALEIAKLLLSDSHDLIHKAAGWMLREIYKRNANVLEAFLDQQCETMPRTMLRYAIERMPEEKRNRYMRKPALTK